MHKGKKRSEKKRTVLRVSVTANKLHVLRPGVRAVRRGVCRPRARLALDEDDIPEQTKRTRH